MRCFHQTALFLAVVTGAVGVEEGAAPSSIALSTLQALDLDKNGKVDRLEVEKFAQLQGLSKDQAQAEFADMDKNGDGILEVEEIGATADESQTAVAAAPAAPAAPETVAETAPETVAKAPAESAAPSSEAELLEDVSGNVGREAARAVAAELARRAQKALGQRVEDASGAESLAALAQVLRSNASAMALAAPGLVQKAAEEASAARMQETMSQVKNLQRKAEEEEERALKARQEATKAMGFAEQAEVVMKQQVAKLSA